MQYYVVRDKNTGLYFRGKGVNKWGKYYNQATIYRIKANAENTVTEENRRGADAEVVPIQIIEGLQIMCNNCNRALQMSEKWKGINKYYCERHHSFVLENDSCNYGILRERQDEIQ